MDQFGRCQAEALEQRESQMNKGKKIFLFVAFIDCIYASMFFIPSFSAHDSIYFAADKEIEDSAHGRDLISSADVQAEPTRQFIIFQNKLYLRTQRDNSSLMGEVKEIDEWNIENLHNFRQQHPELNEYWPDINASNLGVKWVN